MGARVFPVTQICQQLEEPVSQSKTTGKILFCLFFAFVSSWDDDNCSSQ